MWQIPLAPLPRAGSTITKSATSVSANAIFNTSRDAFSPFAQAVFNELSLCSGQAVQYR